MIFVGWLFVVLHLAGRTVLGRIDDDPSNLPADRASGDGGLLERSRVVVDPPPIAPERRV